jgi:hypothetical protein
MTSYDKNNKDIHAYEAPIIQIYYDFLVYRKRGVWGGQNYL